MTPFAQLLSIIDKLMGPDGCEWDRAQTLHSMRGALLEEACELIDAIDLEDNEHIQEELGDLFFNAVFLLKLAEKEGRCGFEKVIQGLSEKLVRRHPHVFGNEKVEGVEGVLAQWDKIKREEKGKASRTSVLDGIPKGLPALARAQKVLRRIHKQGKVPDISQKNDKEQEIGQEIVKIVERAQKEGIDAEQALRSAISSIESKFRALENK